MKGTKVIFLAILFSLLFLSCSSENNPLLPFQQELAFPLQEGMTWKYQRILITTQHFLNQSAGDSIRADTTVFQVTVTVLGRDTLEGVGEAFRLLEEGRYPWGSYPTDYSAEAYYQLKADGLYQVAYRGSGITLPRERSGFQFSFLGKSFASARELSDFLQQRFILSSSTVDSVIIEQPPAKVLPNPLAIGLTWLFRDVPELFRIEKTIAGLADLETPAGKFRTYRVHYLYHPNSPDVTTDNIELTDFIGEAGLIRRLLIIKNVQATTQEGTGTSYFDVKDDAILQHWGKYTED